MPAAPDFDLQSHSTRSDGTLPPAEVVERAHAAGVRLLALTDHDTVAGVDEALATAARITAERPDAPITVVPAAEISALDGEHEDLHVCAYRIDHHDPALNEALADARRDRLARGRRMAQAMRELGWAVELPDVDPAQRPLGRPHLAAAVFEHPANAVRVAAEGLADSSALLEAYLVPGRPGYRRRTTPTVAEAIAVIHAAGGLAVWAHPFWDVHDPDDVRATIARFAALGLDGVEAFYVTHSAEQTRVAHEAAREHGLLTTGSADFHGPEHPRFNRFRAFALYGLEPQLGPLRA